MPRLTSHTSDSGFTVVELLVAVILTGVIGSVMVTGVVRSLQVTQEATDRVDALTEMQRAAERMARDIRGADPVIAADATTLRFVLFDDVTRRRITYTYDSGAGTIVQRTETFPTHTSTATSSDTTATVIDELTLATPSPFAYVMGDGTPWTSANVGEIARVQLLLRRTLESEPVELSTSTFLRNTLTTP